MRCYSSDIGNIPDWKIGESKSLNVYTDDDYLQNKYEKMPILVGREDLVSEMWESKMKILSTVYDPSKVKICGSLAESVCSNGYRPPRKIEVDFKLPTDVDAYFDVSSLTTFMYAAENGFMRNKNSVFATKALTDYLQIDGTALFVKPTIPSEVRLF